MSDPVYERILKDMLKVEESRVNELQTSDIGYWVTEFVDEHEQNVAGPFESYEQARKKVDELGGDGKNYNVVSITDYDVKRSNESKVDESYGNVYIEDDIRNGVSEEEIVKKIRSRYSWISQTQARQIYVDIKNGKTPNWIVKEANEENNEEEESQKKNTLVMAKDISKKLQAKQVSDLSKAPPEDSNWSKFAKYYNFTMKDLDRFGKELGFDNWYDLDMSISPIALNDRNPEKFNAALAKFDLHIEEPRVNESNVVKAVLGVLYDKGSHIDIAELEKYLYDLNVDDYNDLKQAVELDDKDEIARILKNIGFEEENESELKESDQLVMGIEIEKEHTDNPEEAKKIALDHLKEDPKYYTKFKRMEAGACDDVENESKTNEGNSYLQNLSDMELETKLDKTIKFSKTHPNDVDTKNTVSMLQDEIERRAREAK